MENSFFSLRVALLYCFSASFFGQGLSRPLATNEIRVDDLVAPALAVARREGTPVGVIVSQESYCALVSNSATPSNQDTTREAFERIAVATEGSVISDGKVLVLSVGTTPERLTEALRFKFPRFPAVDGTMPYLAALLNGWMLSTLPENKGFGFDIGSSSNEESLHLSESKNLSVQEIADKIISLGHKGIWIASDSDNSSTESARTLSIEFLSYADTRAAARVKCP